MSAVLDRRTLAVEYVTDHAQRPPGLIGRLGIGETWQALDGLEVSVESWTPQYKDPRMEKQANKSQRGASSKMHKQMSMTLAEVLRKYQSHPEFLGLVLSDPNQKGAMEDSPLHIAARRGEVEDIEVLLAHGGNVNLIGDIGNTPLHESSLAGRVNVVKKLLELGADPSIKNEFAQTALNTAT